jgi:hypothetical protein
MCTYTHRLTYAGLRDLVDENHMEYICTASSATLRVGLIVGCEGTCDSGSATLLALLRRP